MNGIILAVAGSFLTGSGLFLQKLAHKQILEQNKEQSYIKTPIWWTGILLLGLGELGNFSAYALVHSAAIIAPIGAISVIFNAIISRIWLKENITWTRIGGILLAVVGIVLVTAFAPRAHETDVYLNIVSWRSLVYFSVVITSAILTALYIRNSEVQLLTCCIFCGFMGSITVTSSKVISTALKLALSGSSTALLTDPRVCWLTYFLFVALFISVVLQLRYLNIALKHFDSSQVSPTHYIIFTTVCISAFIIVFGETNFDSNISIALFVVGLIMAYIGVYLVIGYQGSTIKIRQKHLLQNLDFRLSQDWPPLLRIHLPLSCHCEGEAASFQQSHRNNYMIQCM